MSVTVSALPAIRAGKARCNGHPSGIYYATWVATWIGTVVVVFVAAMALGASG